MLQYDYHTFADVKTDREKIRTEKYKNISRQEREDPSRAIAAKCTRKTRERLANEVTWTRNAGDDTGVTDASELTRCRRVPDGDVGGGFRFSWTVAVPRARNNRAAVVVVAPSRTDAAARRCIDIGDGGRVFT